MEGLCHHDPLTLSISYIINYLFYFLNLEAYSIDVGVSQNTRAINVNTFYGIQSIYLHKEELFNGLLYEFKIRKVNQLKNKK